MGAITSLADASMNSATCAEKPGRRKAVLRAAVNSAVNLEDKGIEIMSLIQMRMRMRILVQIEPLWREFAKEEDKECMRE
jgi:hypothetical protein